MDSALIGILVKLGAGAGVIVVLILSRLMVPWWIYADARRENTLLKDQAAAERKRGDEAVAAMQDTRNVMAALQMGLDMGRGDRQPSREAAPQGPPP